MTDINKQIDLINSRDVVDRLLVINKYKEVSKHEIACCIGLTQEEMEFVDLFWDRVYNHEWIEVTRDLVAKYFSKQNTKDTFNQFIRRKLSDDNNLCENMDYKISNNRQVCSLAMSDKTPANKKFCEITIETFKYLLAKSKTKYGLMYIKYMLKLERLAMVMHEYISRVNKHQADLYSRALFEFMCDIKQYEQARAAPVGYVYVATTNQYMKDNMYKIGATLDPDQRLSNLNTAHDIDDSLFILTSYHTLFYKEKEKLIHKILDSHRNSKRREFFTIEYIKLVEILNHAIGSAPQINQ